MHMLMPMGMHMHPVLRIRFERNAPISAPAAQEEIEAKRTGADIGAGARKNGQLWIQKKPGVLRRQASRFLAPYLTWRQEAANHHDIDCARQSRAHPRRRQGLPPHPANCRFGGQLRLPIACARDVTPLTRRKVVSRVPGARFQRFGDPHLRVTKGRSGLLADGLGSEYIPSIAVVPFCLSLRRPASQRSLTVT